MRLTDPTTTKTTISPPSVEESASASASLPDDVIVTKWRPLKASSAARLFFTGATVGPVVDSLHNQCLLQYNVAPITLDYTYWPTTTTTTTSQAATATSQASHLFASSWTVLPLLGVAYVVLGAILPRIFENLLMLLSTTTQRRNNKQDDDNDDDKKTASSSVSTFDQKKEMKDMKKEKKKMLFLDMDLKSRAIVAVLTTAIIIKLSEYLTLTTATITPHDVLLLLFAALSQWALLDGSLPALLAASITSIGGPLADLPFVAAGVWEYLPSAADYFPLQNVVVVDSSNNNNVIVPLFESMLGPNFQQLGLSSITGPCYFAVTIDAIELGRWFDSMDNNDDNADDDICDPDR